MYRILELNPQLKDFAWDINYRMQLYRDTKARLLPDGAALKDFANAMNTMDFIASRAAGSTANGLRVPISSI